MFIVLGSIAPTAGTPLDLFQNYTVLRGKGQQANSIYFQVDPGNTQDVYIGLRDLNVATDAGMLSTLRPPTANSLSELTMEITNQPNPYNLDDFRIDVANTGDSVRVVVQVY